MRHLYWMILLALVAGCNSDSRGIGKSSTTIYLGGDIITMSGSSLSYAEAVVVDSDIIIFVGARAEANRKYPKAKHRLLNGRTMMPGFIEPHVHASLAASILPNEIIAPYDWVLPDETKKGVSGHDAYMHRLAKSVDAKASTDKIFFVWGYHQLWHGDLSRSLLNNISNDQPIAVIHRSFHEIYLNDAAIDTMKITERDFHGNPQVDWAKGHFYEGGWMALAPKMAPLLLDGSSYMKGLSMMTQLIRKNGITTIAEPGFPNVSFEGEYALLKSEMDKNPPYDVYLIPNGTQLASMKGGNQAAFSFIKTLPEYNTNNLKFLPNQVKLFADGAIYSQLMQMKDDYTDGHHGEWMTPLNMLQEQMSLYWNANYKLHIHANGDKGIQQVLDFAAIDQQENPRQDHRLTLHHMGYFTDLMAQQIAEMGVEASVNPYYLWALSDKYAENGLGAQRARNLVALNSLAKRRIPTSYHSDFAMAPIEPLTLAWTAINRVTSGKTKVSQEQRVDTYTAMQGITISAARTINLENQIGSIESGKTANFTILKYNPFKIDPMLIKDIPVLATVYKGQLYVNKSANLKPKIGLVGLSRMGRP
ncbi:MAG: amidohydrolase family protein [Porticoccaceae bacterium]|nr:amidohydrolase family protein [Porticoccaceae bacterium]MDG1473303.1 amidohydrolase family protein [Porticoccaceae bacterium]